MNFGYYTNSETPNATFSNLSTAFRARTYVQQGTNPSSQFRLGLAFNATSAQGVTDDLNIGQTYLVVLKYQAHSTCHLGETNGSKEDKHHQRNHIFRIVLQIFLYIYTMIVAVAHHRQRRHHKAKVRPIDPNELLTKFIKNTGHFHYHLWLSIMFRLIL